MSHDPRVTAYFNCLASAIRTEERAKGNMTTIVLVYENGKREIFEVNYTWANRTDAPKLVIKAPSFRPKQYFILEPSVAGPNGGPVYYETVGPLEVQ